MHRITRRFCFLMILAIAGCFRYQTDDVRMTGWVSSPYEDNLVRAIVDSFRVEEPDVPVTYNPIQANYNEKLQLMLGTGTAPDLFMLESFWAPALINYDVLMPLDSFITTDPSFLIDDFPPALLEGFRHEGKLYGIPKDYSTLVLFYNRDSFEEAGLNEPPTTWEQLESYARLLTVDRDGDGTQDQYGLGIVESLDYVLPFVWQNDGNIIDEAGNLTLSDPALVEAVEYLQRLKQKEIAALPTDVGAAWNMDGFGRGRFAMVTSGLWALNFMQETFPDVNYGVAPLPHRRQKASIAYIVGYVMPRKTAHPGEAWRLMRFLTGQRGQHLWATANVGLPPRVSVADSLRLSEDSLRSVFVDAAEYARPWQLGANQRLFDEGQTALQSIFILQTPVAEAFRRMGDRLD